MSKIYSLLRNNKQTGPYSLEELIQLQLKPFDLVWAEGKTAGWLYPSEIDDLKPYLAANESLEVQALIHKPETASPEVASSESVASIVSPIKKPHKAIYVSLPARANPVQATDARVITEEEKGEQVESFEERVERMRQRVAAVESGEGTEEEKAGEISTKYTRSLEDIKEEYSSWMKAQKRARRFPLRKIMIGSAAVLVLTAGGWIALSFIDNAPGAQMAQQPVKEADVPTVEKEILAKPEVRGDASTLAVIEHLDRTLKTLEEREKKSTAKSAIQVPKKRVTHPVTKTESAQQPAVAVSNKTKEEETTVSAPQSSRRVKSSVPLSQMVNVKGRVVKARKGIEGVEITLQNNSGQVLKLVAVDVLYHKGNNRVLQRETIYFSDIRPGTSRMLTAPGNRNASGANYELGLISAEGGLYVAR